MSVEYGSVEYKEVMAKIKLALDKAQSAIWEAEALADEAGVSFAFNAGDCYGAGASYDGEEGEWHSSSQNC